MFYEYALQKSQQLTKQISEIEQSLMPLPPGHIVCTKNGNYYKWYHVMNGTKTYLPKKKLHLAEQLAYKKYLIALKKELLCEKNAIDLYLKHHSLKQKLSKQLLTSHSEYRQLLAPYFSPESVEQQNWMCQPFLQNPKHPEQLTIQTSSGNMVRSKSEALIDMTLSSKKIPFRYECSLSLGNVTFYPDFTIRHPLTDKIYYWEHFGLMDDPTYAQKAYSKLQLYTSHGILPSLQLIATFETKENPLSPETISKVVELYFV